MRLLTTKRFEKDLKRGRKRGKNLDKLWRVVNGSCRISLLTHDIGSIG